MKKILKYTLLFITVFAGSMALSYLGLTFLSSEKGGSTVVGITNEISPTPTIAFDLEEAPSTSLRGGITSMAGEIEWQSRLATESAKIDNLQEIQQGERLVTSEESILTFEFSNSCMVEMSESTDIDIIQTLPENIVFSQNEGEATYIQTGTYPISIRAKYLLLELSGEMKVSVNTEETEVVVSVDSGRVSTAYNDLDYVSYTLSISEGEVYTFNYDTRRGVLE